MAIVHQNQNAKAESGYIVSGEDAKRLTDYLFNQTPEEKKAFMAKLDNVLLLCFLRLFVIVIIIVCIIALCMFTHHLFSIFAKSEENSKPLSLQFLHIRGE